MRIFWAKLLKDCQYGKKNNYILISQGKGKKFIDIHLLKKNHTAEVLPEVLVGLVVSNKNTDGTVQDLNFNRNYENYLEFLKKEYRHYKHIE